MRGSFFMVLRHHVHTGLDRVEMCESSPGMARADLESLVGPGCGCEFADFAGAVGFYGGKVRAGDAGVIDHADFHGVGGEADILTVLPGSYISAADGKAGINAKHAL